MRFPPIGVGEVDVVLRLLADRLFPGFEPVTGLKAATLPLCQGSLNIFCEIQK